MSLSARSRSKALGAALLAMVAAIPLLWVLRDFTVDDALITARVAHRLATGSSYRFNSRGPLADAVTPLGYAFLLVPAARQSALAALSAAKGIGAAAYLLSCALLGYSVATLGKRRIRHAPLAVLACSAPLAAWAASGMETGVVTLLCTAAFVCRRGSSAAAGLAAAWRPELIPWAIALTALSALAEHKNKIACALDLSLAIVPSLVVLAVRSAVFGHAAPLALLAKPSDLEHGAVYALGAVVGTGALPLLCAATKTYARLKSRHALAVLSIVIHVLSLLLAGGDWMALYRLFVPVLPGVVLISCALAEQSSVAATLSRVAAALAICALLWFRVGLRATHVGSDRAALIERARPFLGDAHCVAALDAGWVGVATEADVLDLAGVTDRSVARLPGGHTSKRIPLELFDRRGVDTLVLLLAPHASPSTPWWKSDFDRAVERRVAALSADLGFDRRAVLRLGGTEQSYLIVQRRGARQPTPPQ